jgi:hypothetical protein
MGLSGGSLHVQYAGDATVRRLEPHDLPLIIQNEFLAGLGYESVATLQAAGVAEELSYLVKFYAGEPKSAVIAVWTKYWKSEDELELSSYWTAERLTLVTLVLFCYLNWELNVLALSLRRYGLCDRGPITEKIWK